MPHTDRDELIGQLLRELADDTISRPDVAVLVAAALLAASSHDLLADAMRAASTTADRQFVAIVRAHVAGDHGRVDALARDHLLDHALRPVLAWVVARSRAASTTTTTTEGAHR